MKTSKRKKVRRLRGSKTHGWGVKKHRGAGNKGGTGMAGSGKRAQSKKMFILKYYGPEYYGGKGFNVPASVKNDVKAINIRDLPLKENVNLTEMGYDKLLAKGKPKLKHNITVSSFSAKAKEKIEKAGGKILTK